MKRTIEDILFQDLPLNGAMQEPETPRYADKLREATERVRANAARPITFSKPILTRKNAAGEEEAVIFPNTLNVISGKTGLHKSRIAEIITSAFLNRSKTTYKTLGFTADEQREYAVLLIDSERNLTEQLPFAVQEIREKAGYQRTEEVKNFLFTSVLDLPRNERAAALREFFAGARQQFRTEHIICVIDVISDVCENFNDVRAVMPLLDDLNRMVNHFNTTICAVIHQNPSDLTDKARGHLGSELENKASAIITITKHERDGVFTVKCKKQRSAKPFEQFFVQYDKTISGLVEIDKSDASGVVEIRWELMFKNDTELLAGVLRDRVMQAYNLQNRQARRYITDATQRGELIAFGHGKNRKLSLPDSEANSLPSTAKMFDDDEPPF